MPAIEARCLVPDPLKKYVWPTLFQVLPRVGELIRPLGKEDVHVVVTHVVHVNQRHPFPNGTETVVELRCAEAKDLLLE
jgi:hypothetical protein